MKSILITFATLVVAVSSMAADIPTPPVSAAAAATEEIGHNAENLYDWGRQSNWTRARTDLAALNSAVAKLAATGSVTDLRPARTRVAAIESAIQNRRPRALMHEANEMTGLAADLSRPFKPQVPVEVTKLDYEGRELELWAEEGKMAELNETRMRLRELWSTLRPAVESKGGATEVRQFDALLSQLSAAKTPNEFAAVATPILDTVDSLETVFTRGSV